MYRKVVTAVTLWLFLCSPAVGFDTFWHAQAISRVGEEFGFSEDARNIMKLGNFSPDFFGPVAQYAADHVEASEQEALRGFGVQNANVRASAVFLHFDNLAGELDRNSDFEYVFKWLLENTRKQLADYQQRSDLDEATRKTLILVTLGASLHSVQDFYSHSDWVHNDFDKTAVKMVRSASGVLRAPTWFEVSAKLADPDKWPFQVHSGIYPPTTGAKNTHTHMNHDNSRLLYREEESSGQPLLSQAQYHNAGPAPARPQDPGSILRHQQLAVDTATSASIEWVSKVQEDPEAKAAIESAKHWQLRTENPKLAQELQAGLAVQLFLSCAAGRWDGEEPPPERGAVCDTINQKGSPLTAGTNPLASGGGSILAQLESQATGLAAGLAFPLALRYTGKFWDVHLRYAILERLTQGFSSETTHYHLPASHESMK